MNNTAYCKGCKKGWILPERTEQSDIGYLPHFISCPASKHIKRAKAAKKSKPAPIRQPEPAQLSMF